MGNKKEKRSSVFKDAGKTADIQGMASNSKSNLVIRE